MQKLLRFLVPRCGALMAALAAAGALHAQGLPEGVRFGMRADELQAAQAGVEAVARPQRMAGGLVGAWRGAPAMIGGLPFTPTFFFAAGRLARIEFVATAKGDAELGARVFDEILAWGRQRFGPEMASGGAGSQYAAWMQGELDIYAQRIDDKRHASVLRVVHAVRERKDDSAL